VPPARILSSEFCEQLFETENRSFNSEFHGVREEDILSKFQAKIEERMLDSFADKMVGMPHTSNSISHPTQHNSKQAFRSRDYHTYRREDVFGIGGYACPECTELNPIIFTFLFPQKPQDVAPNYYLELLSLRH
jgi:uncharacterized short protein YbdD (DUF466 family)